MLISVEAVDTGSVIRRARGLGRDGGADDDVEEDGGGGGDLQLQGR